MKQIDWKINWRKLKLFPKSAGLSILLLLAVAMEVLFLVLLLALDVLPALYVILIILILALIDFVILQLINGVKHRRTKTLVAMIIAVLMMNILLVGDVYVYSTYDTLKKISEWHDTWEYYDVVALKDGSYAEVGDVKNQTVYTVDMESKQLTEATERLVTKENVEIDTVSGLLNLGQVLVDDGSDVKDVDVSELDSATEEEIAAAAEKAEADKAAEETEPTKAAKASKGVKLNDKLILVSHSGYKLIKSNIKGFKKNTQIIYRIKVKKRADDTSKAVDVTKDSFNVLVSGLDSWGTIDEGGLSDVNMVMTVNPQTRQILLTSIPRDSYVPLHSYGEKDKLTHAGIYGSEETKKTIEDLLGIDINYTVRVNFSMLCDLIDAIGRIDVYNDVDFYSSVKGWHYSKGWHHMDGHYALWFARERKAFPEGDMKRNENQQKVMEALIKKVTSSKVILTRYTSILAVVEDKMQTDMKDRDMKRLVKMQLSDMKKWTIERANLKGTTGSAPCFSMGNENLSCVFLYDEDVENCKQAIHDVMFPVHNTETQTTEAADSTESSEE